jgi:anti-anti-sigma regulatory factor
MFRIQRVMESGTATFIVIGRISAKHLPELQELFRSEGTHIVVLNLTEVTIVDREVVRFLVQCEKQGIGLAKCPAYIREWMIREKGSS